MKDNEEKKICISTYESSGSIKTHSVISFNNLNDLKTQLKEEGVTSVGLVRFSWFDESENRIRSGIRIDDLTISDINWCNEKSVEFRYLSLYRR